MRGKFIVLEGPEGGGKTTVAKELGTRLLMCGHGIVTLREPGGTKLGEAIRDILKKNAAGEAPGSMAEMFLFQAARAQLVENQIRPALESGMYVIMDRFYDSTTAYQGYARGLDLDMIEAMNKAATGGLVPDLTVLLDVPVKEGLKRATSRNKGSDRFDDESVAFHAKVRGAYQEIMVNNKGRRWVYIDASASEEQVVEKVWFMVGEELKEMDK